MALLRKVISVSFTPFLLFSSVIPVPNCAQTQVKPVGKRDSCSKLIIPAQRRETSRISPFGEMALTLGDLPLFLTIIPRYSPLFSEIYGPKVPINQGVTGRTVRNTRITLCAPLFTLLTGISQTQGKTGLNLTF